MGDQEQPKGQKSWIQQVAEGRKRKKPAAGGGQQRGASEVVWDTFRLAAHEAVSRLHESGYPDLRLYSDSTFKTKIYIQNGKRAVSFEKGEQAELYVQQIEFGEGGSASKGERLCQRVPSLQASKLAAFLVEQVIQPGISHLLG